MTQESRGSVCAALGRGLLSAVGVSAAGMALLALAGVYARIGDGALLSLNQVLKLLAVFAGAWTAVGPGGRRGFASGAVIGLVYIALGYGVCALWERQMTVSGGMLALEFAMGMLLGGVSGALVANLPAGKARGRRRAA